MNHSSVTLVNILSHKHNVEKRKPDIQTCERKYYMIPFCKVQKWVKVWKTALCPHSRFQKPPPSFTL
jgi:hypothetical protein